MEEAAQTRSLVNRIRRGQAVFFGYVIRRGKFRTLYHYGETGSKTRQGGQREQTVDSLVA